MPVFSTSIAPVNGPCSVIMEVISFSDITVYRFIRCPGIRQHIYYIQETQIPGSPVMIRTENTHEFLLPDTRFGFFQQRKENRTFILDHPDCILAALEFALAATYTFFSVNPAAVIH